jgi:hypothetical protein
VLKFLLDGTYFWVDTFQQAQIRNGLIIRFMKRNNTVFVLFSECFTTTQTGLVAQLNTFWIDVIAALDAKHWVFPCLKDYYSTKDHTKQLLIFKGIYELLGFNNNK